MISVYVAGTLVGADKAETIRRRGRVCGLLAEAGFSVYDPFADEHKMWTGERIPEGPPLDTMRAFVNKDLRQVRKADVVLVLTGDVPSDGTWQERDYSYMIGGIVVMVAPRRKRGELVSFSNVRSHYIAGDDEEAVRWLKENLYEAADGGLYLKEANGAIHQ